MKPFNGNWFSTRVRWFSLNDHCVGLSVLPLYCHWAKNVINFPHLCFVSNFNTFCIVSFSLVDQFMHARNQTTPYDLEHWHLLPDDECSPSVAPGCLVVNHKLIILVFAARKNLVVFGRLALAGCVHVLYIPVIVTDMSLCVLRCCLILLNSNVQTSS